MNSFNLARKRQILCYSYIENSHLQKNSLFSIFQKPCLCQFPIKDLQNEYFLPPLFKLKALFPDQGIKVFSSFHRKDQNGQTIPKHLNTIN